MSYLIERFEDFLDRFVVERSARPILAGSIFPEQYHLPLHTEFCLE
jgi:hypothetical protein